MIPVQTRFEELRFDYDGAFERFCAEVRALRSLEAHGDADAARELPRRVEAARAEYNKARDELAEFLLRRRRSSPQFASSAPCIYYDGT